MIRKKAFKVRLYPNKKQEQQINQTIGNCRFWYNKCLEHVISWKKEHGSYEGFKQLNPKDFKKELEWLALGSSRGLQQAQNDLTEAFKNMKKMGSGFPKFKKKGMKDSYREPQTETFCKVLETKIKLLKLGFVSFKASGSYLDILQTIKICNVTISKNKVGHYFASILCDVEIPTLPVQSKSIGIDLGLKEFAVMSDKTIIENPHFGRNSENKTKTLQRRLSRKVKGSNRYEKQRVKLAKVHLHVSNQRNHFLNELSSKIANESQVICLEDLHIKGIVRNHKLAKAIHDVSWSSFVTKLKYKSGWYGRTIHQVDRFFPSSKTCSSCGWKKVDLTLKDRTFKCEKCGLEIDRDYNASINILNQGMAELAKTDPKGSTFVDKSASVDVNLLTSVSNLDEAKNQFMGRFL